MHLIFNRHQLKLHRNRTAKAFSKYDFLLERALEMLCDRLDDTTRSFPLALNLHCHTGQLARVLEGRGGIKQLVQADIAFEMVKRAAGLKLVCDEELLPFRAASFDLVLSALGLHWVNDVPGTLIQVRQILKADGVMMMAFLGGETLTELRQVLMKAAVSLGYPVSPYVMPTIDVKDAGALLQRAGFFMPVVDSDRVTVSYSSLFSLLEDIKGMGQSSILTARAPFSLTRSVLAKAASLYEEMFPMEEGRIKATFEIITMTGLNVTL